MVHVIPHHRWMERHTKRNISLVKHSHIDRLSRHFLIFIYSYNVDGSQRRVFAENKSPANKMVIRNLTKYD